MFTSAEWTNPPIPKHVGTYALILRLPSPASIRIGKLGEFDFPAGYYLYVGSAFGPGGLAGRLNRHLAPATATGQGGPRLHWHIDYLRQRAGVEEIWCTKQDVPREHAWAALASQLSGATVPAPRFGASDCHCRSHLFYFERQPGSGEFRQLIRQHLPDDVSLHVERR